MRCVFKQYLSLVLPKQQTFTAQGEYYLCYVIISLTESHLLRDTEDTKMILYDVSLAYLSQSGE